MLTSPAGVDWEALAFDRSGPGAASGSPVPPTYKSTRGRSLRSCPSQALVILNMSGFTP